MQGETDMKRFDDLKQMALPMLMEVPKPRRLPEVLIEAVRSDAEAMALCLQHRVRRLTEGEIAEQLGLKKAHFARVKAGSHNLTRAQQTVLQYLCSNFAIDQYGERIAQEIQEATETPAERISRLEARVAQLEGRKAA